MLKGSGLLLAALFRVVVVVGLLPGLATAATAAGRPQ